MAACRPIFQLASNFIDRTVISRSFVFLHMLGYHLTSLCSFTFCFFFFFFLFFFFCYSHTSSVASVTCILLSYTSIPDPCRFCNQFISASHDMTSFANHFLIISAVRFLLIPVACRSPICTVVINYRNLVNHV